MTDEFTKALETPLPKTVEGEPHVKEQLLIYLEHRKKYGEKARSASFVENWLEINFPDKWTPKKTAIRTWVNKMEKGNGKQ